MSSPLSTSSGHRIIAPVPLRPRSSSGQPRKSQNILNPQHSPSPEPTIGTGQTSSSDSCASTRRHSYRQPDVTADPRHFSPLAADPSAPIFRFGQTGNNSQYG